DGPGVMPAASWLDPGAYDSIPLPDSSNIPDLYGPTEQSPSSPARNFYFPDIGEPEPVNSAAFGPGGGGSGFGSVGGVSSAGGYFPNFIDLPDYPASPPDILSQSGNEYGFHHEFGSSSSYFGDPVVEPIILDLDGNGVRIETLKMSRTYFDMEGNGGRNRTAWAAAGDGVLAIDANGDGKIDQRSEVVLTDWAEMAGNDMQAMRMVFDSNNNGWLDGGDARWKNYVIFSKYISCTMPLMPRLTKAELYYANNSLLRGKFDPSYNKRESQLS
ncbi:MAG: hypothetical protein ACRCYS_14720, partial [Beijerinckiaceae bacterium]